MTKLALRLAIVIATVGLVASGTGYSMRPAQSADPTACPGEPAPAFTAKDNRGEDRHPCLLPRQTLRLQIFTGDHDEKAPRPVLVGTAGSHRHSR